ncbi:MAG: exodeoxyribonuclease V subunit alpha, partial [Chitinispirillaceae bacterium]|nr:exodeoxyribonuclease V subunit alpha [Chitinispirillaceae bacterium]
LEKGVPRADVAFLTKPLNEQIVAEHAKTFESKPDWADNVSGPEKTEAIKAILEGLLIKPDTYAPLSGSFAEITDERAPLLVADTNTGMIGFSRYWKSVVSLEDTLRQRLIEPLVKVDNGKAREVLEAIFGKETILSGTHKFHHRQVAAAALALLSRFLIVSGGPGTGKTSVVIQMLRALSRYDLSIKPERIVLCAPTGRAKARMGESVDAGIMSVEKSGRGNPFDFALKKLGRKTLHGLLGVRPDGTRKYDEKNLLPYDVIVVDEASMVDLHLFDGLMAAAHPGCRIILLGDMNQLPSVEAGAVLGDLTERFLGMGGFPTLTKETAELVKSIVCNVDAEKDQGSLLEFSSEGDAETAGFLADHTIILTRSYRSKGGIQELCELIKKGSAAEALALIRKYPGEIAMESGEAKTAVRAWLQERYCGEKQLAVFKKLSFLDTEAIGDEVHDNFSEVNALLANAWEIVQDSRILVLGHAGARGREQINRDAAALLRRELRITGNDRFFPGQQVVLQQNHHDLDLYNGDPGIVVRARNGGLKVVFCRGEGGFIAQAVDRLAGLEPAFAMTVHKSQGSEFKSVLLVLPDYKSALLSRQIIYTGISRARDFIRILGRAENLTQAIMTREERPGGVAL